MFESFGQARTVRRTVVLGSLLVFALTTFAGSVWAQTTTSTSSTTTTTTTTTTLPPYTHLKCYRVKDDVDINGPKPSWLDLESLDPALGTESCRIAGKFRLVCIPVRAEIPDPSLVTVDGMPFVPIMLPSTESLEQDRICYRVKCSGGNDFDASTLFIDEFKERTLSKFKSRLVCGPAARSLCGNGIVEPNEVCDDGNRTDDDCCSSDCMERDAEGAQPMNCKDTDGNQCTTRGCSAEGVCDQGYVLEGSDKTCGDSSPNDCNEARCDAGECVQDLQFEPDGESCADDDGEPCTLGSCLSGACLPNVFVAPGQIDPTGECQDTDGDACTDARCDGQGVCDQAYFIRDCPGGTTCTPATGVCE